MKKQKKPLDFKLDSKTVKIARLLKGMSIKERAI